MQSFQSNDYKEMAFHPFFLKNYLFEMGMGN